MRSHLAGRRAQGQEEVKEETWILCPKLRRDTNVEMGGLAAGGRRWGWEVGEKEPQEQVPEITGFHSRAL